MSHRRNPLYLTIVDDHFVQCHKSTGDINWVNTRAYTVKELDAVLRSGREVHLLPKGEDLHLLDENKPDWFDKILKDL